jgi:hypothetical protein
MHNAKAHLAVYVSKRNLDRRVVVLQPRRPNGTFTSPTVEETTFATAHLSVKGKVVR